MTSTTAPNDITGKCHHFFSSFFLKKIMLQWSLFFVLAFFIASIQCADVPDLEWFAAKINFEYMAIDEKGEEVPMNHHDTILMVAIGNNQIVGSAQSYCRHINPPLEQVILLQGTSRYYRYDSSGRYKEEDGINTTQSCAPLTYGCITLVHNYCSVTYDIPIVANKTTILSKNHKKPAVGSKLIAVYSIDVLFLNRLVAVEVTVKDFTECEKQFDPESVYLVDADEQICTEQIYPKLGDYPTVLPSALLFEKVKDKYYLVGIESKAENALSLSTFAPYHCKKFEKACV